MAVPAEMKIGVFGHAGPVADFLVERAGQDGVEVPLVARFVGERPVLVIFDHAGEEIWQLDLAEFQRALNRAEEVLTTWPRLS